MTNAGKVLLGLGVVGAATLAYVGLAKADEDMPGRNFRLVQGRRYVLSVDVQGYNPSDLDAIVSMFGGFIDPSQPNVYTYNSRGLVAARVSFEATWAGEDGYVWLVPENVQIA